MTDQDNIPEPKGTEEVTPEVAAVSKEVEQPVEAPVQKSEAEILKEELDALRTKNERYLNVIHGKDKQIEDLSAKVVAKNLERAKAPVVDDTYEYEPEPQPKAAKVATDSEPSMQTQLLVKSAISMNKNSMAESFSGDNILPWSKETAAKVEAEIIRRDPSRLSILDEGIWESTYHRLRSEAATAKIADHKRVSEAQAKAEADRLARVIVDKEKAKQAIPVIENKPVKKDTVDPVMTDFRNLSPVEFKCKHPGAYENIVAKSLGLI